MRIIRTKNYKELSIRAAQFISTQVGAIPDSVLGLATGSTPIGIYEELISEHKNNGLDFSEVHTINLDEYVGLGTDHEQSYYHYMHRTFFDHINIQKENTHLPNGLADNLLNECDRYDKIITDLGGIDLQLLGIGSTGHIGFNEPFSSFIKYTHIVDLTKQTIKDNSRFFESASQTPRRALTVGIKGIMDAIQILLVATGEEKAKILRDALFGPVTPELPASILQFHPNVIVIADEDALKLFP